MITREIISPGSAWCQRRMPSLWLSIVSVPRRMGKDRIVLNYDLYVYQIKKDGSLGESKPCYHCLREMKRSRMFRYCYYSTAEGKIVRERVSEMISTHICSGRKTGKFT